MKNIQNQSQHTPFPRFLFVDRDVLESNEPAIEIDSVQNTSLIHPDIHNDVRTTSDSVEYILDDSVRTREANFPREYTIQKACEEASDLSNSIYEAYVDPESFYDSAVQAYESYFDIRNPKGITAFYFTEQTLKNFADELGVELSSEMINQKLEEAILVETLKKESVEQKFLSDSYNTMKAAIARIEDFLDFRLPLSQKRQIAQRARQQAEAYKILQMDRIDRDSETGAVDDLVLDVLFQYFLLEFSGELSVQLKEAYQKYLETGIRNETVVNRAIQEIGLPKI
jgi:hypothetical protein